ncbi:MAG: PKD domain-containing protein [Ferruginibacter sp.]
MTTFSLAKTGCLFILLTLLGFCTKAQLQAEFSANPTSGCTPLVVNFTDQSTGNPTQWRWDLGNGTISFLQNPSVTYFIPGQYNIKLVVQNAGGMDSIIKSQYITIFAQPVVDFSASPRSGCYPLPTQFTDLCTTSNGTLTNWQWDFGDGTFGNTQNPVHTYTAAGSYNVSLAVTNSNGCSATLTKNQYILIANGASAAFSNTTSNSCTAPVSINFQNLSTGTGVLTYLWNFGDGNTSTQTNPSHNFTSAGSYSVQLIVTNSTGCHDTVTRPNAVTIGTVNTMFSIPDSTCVGTAISINNTSAPVPASVLWDFGDATISTAISPVKTYTAAGTYQVKLINNFGACIDSLTRNIVVSPLPVVIFNTNDTLACNAPFTVHFNNISIGALTYNWSFGDGGTSTLQNPVHTYTTPGNFSVTLTCTNIFGCKDSIIRQSYIRIQLPNTTINNLPQKGCAPLVWTFTSVTTSSEPVTGYLWNFGDGGTSTSATPTHSFAPGTYNIQLIVTTASGCTDTTIVTNGIRAGIKPHANFSATPRDVCAYLPVNFTDLSTGNADQWLWDFGDGGTSTSQNPTHIYGDTGYFNIQLIVWNNGCPDTLKLADYVHINPPIASFTVAAYCTDPLKRVFTDHSIGADEWNWDFGDGTTSNIPSPTHVYLLSGTYTVTLLVRNLTTGCTYTKTSTERVIDEHADFIATDTVICRMSTVTFSAVGSNPANIGVYQWAFGDGATGTGHDVSHIYTVSGLYDVSLFTVDWNGCRDTLIRQRYIRVNGPTAGFTVPVVATCLLSTITFTDTSSNDGIHPIIQWIWNYGDGIIDTLTSGPTQHTYALPGVYSVTLTVTDNNGCQDSIIRTSLLTISKPVAGFNAVDTLTCPGRNILFLNSSTGSGLIYHWNFGDGSISINANPTHAYAANGVYTVKLMIIDQYGCTDSITRTNYISIVTPLANFTVSDSVGTCPPLIVTFTNTSLNYTTQSWDFGDGTSSLVANPSHFYNTPGIFQAVLTVTGPGGCTSTKQQTITLRGPLGSFTYGPLTGCQPLTVNFTANTQNRVSFIWDFSDGNTLATTDSIISHTYTIPGRYVPKMILVDAGGCTVPITGPDTIFVHAVRAGLDFDPPVICSAGSVQFTSTSTSADMITGFQWDFGDGSTSVAPNPVHYYNTPGLYYPSLKVTTAFGCTDSIHSSLPVKIVAAPQGQIAQSANGCTPVTITFNGSLAVADTSAMSWQWDFANGNTSTLINPPAQTYTVAGTYPVSLVVTNSTGCKDTILTSIQAFAKPDVNAGVDTLICQGTGRSLQATGAVTYIWSPPTGLSCTNCANPIATPDSIITYTVTGTSAQGCINSDAVVVKVKYPLSMTNSPGDSLCKGSSLAIFASGAFTYTWSPATGLNNPSISSPIASPLVSTTYMVIGRDDRNCFSDTAYIPVTVFDLPTVEAGPDKTINVGQTLDLVPVISADVISVMWNPTGSIFRSDYPSITVKPKVTTTYTVEVANSGGCRSRDNVTVYVICNGSNVFIPNTFSPNADGANDIFYPRGKGLFSIKTARVFNRWGEVVYEKSDFMPNDASAGWDGTYKGQKLNIDVYVYVIEIMCDNNSILTFKGNIALIK